MLRFLRAALSCQSWLYSSLEIFSDRTSLNSITSRSRWYVNTQCSSALLIQMQSNIFFRDVQIQSLSYYVCHFFRNNFKITIHFSTYSVWTWVTFLTPCASSPIFNIPMRYPTINCSFWKYRDSVTIISRLDQHRKDQAFVTFSPKIQL